MQVNSKLLLKNLPSAAVYYFDCHGYYLGGDGQHFRLRECEVSHIASRCPQEIFPPREAQTLKAAYQKAWKGEVVQWPEHTAVGLFWETVKTIETDGQKIGLHISQKLSVSAQPYSQEEMLRSRIESIFELSFKPLLILDGQTHVLAANHFFTQQFEGLLPDDMEGCGLEEISFWSKDQVERLRKGMAAADRGDMFQTVIGFYIDGESLFFELSLKALTVGEKRIYLMKLLDVTESERSRTALTNSQLILEKQNEELEEMAFMISHNLRAPAANMTYLISLLERCHNDLEREDLYGAFKQSTTKILNTLDIIGDSLNVRRGRDLHFETVQVEGLIQGVLEEFGDLIQQEEVQINVDVYDDRKDWMVPEDTIRQGLREAVSNSLRYRDPQKKRLKISILCYRRNGERVIEITDNGLGINMERNGHKVFGLFQTFHRHKEARGVGLFQLKNRLAAIGGDVTLDSEEGHGTTLTLNFKTDERKKALVHY